MIYIKNNFFLLGYLIMVCFLFGTPIPLLSQAPLDSLKNALDHTTDKKQRANLLYDIISHEGYDGKNFEAYYSAGKQIAEGLNDEILLCNFYMTAGRQYGMSGELEKSVKTYDVGIDICKSAVSGINKSDRKKSLYNKITTAYYNLGVLQKDMGHKDKSAEATIEAMEYVESENIPPPAPLLLAMATMNQEVWDSTKSEFYFRKALKAADNPAQKTGIAYLFGNMFQAFGKLDSASHYYKKSMHLAKQRGDLYYIGQSTKGLTRVNLDQKNWAAAAQFARQGIEAIDGKGMDVLKSDLLSWAARAYWELGNEEEALRLIEESAEIANANGVTVMEAENAEIMSKLYAKKKDFEKAYHFLREFADTMKNSFYDEKRMAFHNTAESKYLIQREENKKIILEEKNKQQKRIISLSVIALILALAVAILFYKSNQQKQQYNRELKSLLNKLEQTNNDLEKDNYLKQKLISIISHNVSGPLKSISNVSHLLEKNIEKYPLPYLQQKMHNIHLSAKELGYLISNIMVWVRSRGQGMPFSKDPFNLKDGVQEMLGLYHGMADEKNITLRSEINDMEVQTDKSILSICLQNLVHNALKYTEAGGQVTISASQFDNKCKLTVSDTGIGMNEERLAQLMNKSSHLSSPGTQGEAGYGLGILIVQEMVEKMNGQLHMKSKKGEGTKVSVEWPL